jgi:heme oxygenase
MASAPSSSQTPQPFVDRRALLTCISKTVAVVADVNPATGNTQLAAKFREALKAARNS